jgi:hypothetical protein
MLIIKNTEMEKAEGEGQWVERELWGATVRLKIRARTENVIKRIRDKFKGMKDGKKKEEAIFEAVYDYLFESFEPIAEELPDGAVKEMEVNFENKKKILFMPVPVGEESNFVWLTNKANELAFEVREEEIKN